MAQKVSSFTPAGTLDGTEIVPVIQGGGNRRTTVQDIADKANAASIIDDAVPAFDKVYSSSKTKSLVDAEAAARAAADTTLQSNIDLKLNSADYNDRYKGKYTTFPALQTAHPTASAGDYAQVDTGAGSNVINYNWDTQDGWVIGSSVGPTLSTTDDLTEGSTNLYFTTARAIAAVDISGKVDKVAGKQLSTEDYTTAEKTKLSGLTNNTGTAGRISITAGVIDIDAAYIGQNTITTLGTIATGTWQGTAIASGYGGTGFSTYAKGDILYASAVNTLAKLTMGTVPDGYVLTAASGLPVWAAASGGSGGGWGLAGNSITSGQFIGTTNAQDLIFKTNNVTQLKLSAAGVLFHSNNLPAVKQYYYDGGAGSRIGVGQLGGNIQFFGLSGGYQFTWNGGGDLNTTAGTNEWMKINGNTGLTVAKDLTVGGNASIAGSFTVATIGSGPTTNLVKQYYYNAIAANSRYGVGMTNDHPYLQFFIPTNANAAAGWSWNIGGDMQTAGVNEIMRLEQNFGLVITGGISAGSGNRAVASALFDLSSTTKGFLPPRMTLTQWGSIATKAEGLQGWNNSDHGQMWFDGTRSIGFRYNGTKFQGYDGTNWLDLN